MALVCPSQGGCEPPFGQTKTSISKAPHGDSQRPDCAHYTQCTQCYHAGSHVLPPSQWGSLISLSFSFLWWKLLPVVPHIISSNVNPSGQNICMM